MEDTIEKGDWHDGKQNHYRGNDFTFYGCAEGRGTQCRDNMQIRQRPPAVCPVCRSMSRRAPTAAEVYSKEHPPGALFLWEKVDFICKIQ